MIFLNVLIEPLKLLFEFIFSTAYKIVPVPAVDIIFLSLAVNLMCFPLYHRADSITKSNNEKQKALAPMIDHIKKCFKGDEKIMMLQTFYRQNDYSPLSSLKSTLSLLLQIPFFIAAYSFLSSLSLLEGQSLGPIKDLMSPDGLIAVGGITVNVLPILMTVINIISSEIYTRGQPFKSKIILYVSALVFLVLLYNCPAGLVFYWTLNNTFSLVKNLIPFKVKEAAEEKGATDRKVAGDADILLFPDIHAGNLTYKTIVRLATVKNGNILTGTKAPVILTSRSDSVEVQSGIHHSFRVLFERSD